MVVKMKSSRKRDNMNKILTAYNVIGMNRNGICDNGIQVTYYASLIIRTVIDERNKECGCLPLT